MILVGKRYVVCGVCDVYWVWDVVYFPSVVWMMMCADPPSPC